MSSPVVAVGIVLLLISASIAANLRDSEHQSNIFHLQTQALLRLSAKLRACEIDLSNLLKVATYYSLYEVSAEADRYPSDAEREKAVATLILQHFKSLLFRLPSREVRVLCEPTSVTIQPAENGFVRARCEINALLSAAYPHLKLTRPLKEIEVFVDCRYFLLQEKMNEFLRRIDEIHDRWRNLEYLNAWGKASTGKVELSRNETATLFEMAWCRQELEIFGSCSPSFFVQFPAAASLTLRSAIEAVEEAMAELTKNKPIRERVEVARIKLEEAKPALSLFPRLRESLAIVESKLEKMENSAENEAGALLNELLEEGGDEEIESWRLGENGLEKIRIRAPKLENLTFPSLLRLLYGASEELSLLTPVFQILRPAQGTLGLSVAREMKVSKIHFCREDPFGKFGKGATPIYLWFLGLTIWWGQYTITLELENEPVEKILDVENPTIPLLHPLPAHYPLSYVHKIPKRRFRTRVVILFPQYFEIVEATR